MVRRGCHLGEKGGHAALSKVPVPSDNKSPEPLGLAQGLTEAVRVRVIQFEAVSTYSRSNYLE